MTYQDLLRDLQAAERWTGDLEACVDAAIKREIERWGVDVVDVAEEQIIAAEDFIRSAVKASWDDTDDYGTQNAYDTVRDYGVDFDSLVGQFIFANTNNPAEIEE